MKYFKLIFIFGSLLFTVPFLAQALAGNVGYAMIGKGKNTGFAGLDYRITARDQLASNIGAGLHLLISDKNLVALPQIHFSQEVFLLNLKIAATTKNIAPSLGFSLLNAAQFNLGYNFAYSDKNYQGIYLSINFFFGNKNFYSSWLS